MDRDAGQEPVEMMNEKDLGADAAVVEGAGSIASPQLTHAAPTPGNWCVRWDKGRCNALIDSVERTETDSYVAMVFGPCDSWPTEANAHLIAAAPDLLEILKVVVSETAGGSWRNLSRENAQKALDAIAKAEGKVIGSATVTGGSQ